MQTRSPSCRTTTRQQPLGSGTPIGLTRTKPDQAYLPPDLGLGFGSEKSGYAITMTGPAAGVAAPACNGAALVTGYVATATPIS